MSEGWFARLIRRVSGGPARRFQVTEVVQTSAMDCGPATLKALLEGFGRPISYGRLREACQTDVDGTSIDVLEEIAGRLGLEASQELQPADHVLALRGAALPAIVVVVLPDGATHFVVAWRALGPFVQIMDPGEGRRWVTRRRFLSELYQHAMPVPAAAWREAAGEEEFQRALAERLQKLGVRGGDQLRATALEDPSARSIAALDAATRLAQTLVDSGGLRAGPDAERLIGVLARNAADDPSILPPTSWSARPQPVGEGEEETVVLRGAVLVRVRGIRPEGPDAGLPPELAAALSEPPPDPLGHLVALLRAGGLAAPALLSLALLLASIGGVVQTVLLRGLLEVAGQLGLVEQRIGALAALGVFALGLLLAELPVTALSLSAGRGLEARLRAAFLEKLPRLGDRYVHSRPTSDMAQRSHAIHVVRTVPTLAARAAQAALHLGATAAGLIWLDAGLAGHVALAVVAAVSVPVALFKPLTSLDLRFRTHSGALSRFYLDAMQGVVAIRTHGAERALRRWHEQLLTDWGRAGRATLSVAVFTAVVQGVIAFGISAGLFLSWLARAADASAALLVVYWALQLPEIGREIGEIIRAYPGIRNVTLRMLEPLGALEDGGDATPEAAAPEATPAAPAAGVEITLRGVTVVAGGHTLLQDVDLDLAPGEHVAVVGPSGAGKSTFVGLLLGWHRAAQGEVRVDGAPLHGNALARLRRQTAWVDPEVHLWNRTFVENLAYGNPDGADLGPIVRASDLVGVLQKLPDGLQQVLGEGGALLSGGEGQRARFGRALGRRDARLVILDEPFRGLDRDKRRALMAAARAWWPGATLLCVTHDVGETRGFPRVLVIEGGRVVEDAAPAELEAQEQSRYRALLDKEEEVRGTLWAAASWRRLRLEHGRVREHRG